MINLTNARQFNADLAAFAKKLELTKAIVYQRVTMELWNGITTRTPVDTGRARSSWNLGIGKPNGSVPQKGFALSLPPNTSAITGEEVVYITSNLDYIEPLENGHSKQAPGGMVLLTVAETVARIQLIMEKMP